MATIFTSKIISAPKEAVWGVISNREGERKCWSSIRSIENKGNRGGRVEREVLTIFGFRFIETTDVEPEKSSIIFQITDGPFTGIKTIALKPADDGKKTIAEVSWNIRFNMMIIRMISPLVKRYISRQTTNAIERMAVAATSHSR